MHGRFKSFFDQFNFLQHIFSDFLNGVVLYYLRLLLFSLSFLINTRSQTECFLYKLSSLLDLPCRSCPIYIKNLLNLHSHIRLFIFKHFARMKIVFVFVQDQDFAFVNSIVSKVINVLFVIRLILILAQIAQKFVF